MPKKQDAATELAEKMLAVLEAQRALGQGAYPLTLQRLAELTDPQAPPELVLKAVGKKPFKDRTVVAHKTSGTASPVALNEDLEQLAASPLLLEFALEKLCSPDSPICAPSKLKSQVDTKLKKPLEEAAIRQIRENSLPPAVGHVLQKNKPLLFLNRIPPPPPPPPPKKKEEVLAESLLQVLEAQRLLGVGAYPPLLSRLIELTDPTAKAPTLKKALAHPFLQDKITLVGLVDTKKPVVLLGDQAQLLSSGWMLEFLMGARRQPNENAFAIEALLPKKSPLLPSLLETVNRQIETNSLPPTVGWMWVNKQKMIFLLDDIHHSRSAEASVPPPAPPSPPPQIHESHEIHKSHESHEPPSDFAPRFDEAFAQHNRQNGGINFVSLVAMRKALPMLTDAFNAELRKLRVAGRYTLSAAEGRHGISPEEHAAGIVEDGSLLLYVSRKAP